ncbi:MAG: hypothetical protein Q4D05_01930, partial [Acinetobacter sp.]|nr:hypothetical protein [Acinetobacter sp.]
EQPTRSTEEIVKEARAILKREQRRERREEQASKKQEQFELELAHRPIEEIQEYYRRQAKKQRIGEDDDTPAPPKEEPYTPRPRSAISDMTGILGLLFLIAIIIYIIAWLFL